MDLRQAPYGYNFLNNRQTTTSNFVGQTATFNNLSSKIDPKSLKLGGGIDIYGANSFVVSGEYIMEKRDKYQSHSGVLRVRDTLNNPQIPHPTTKIS